MNLFVQLFVHNSSENTKWNTEQVTGIKENELQNVLYRLNHLPVIHLSVDYRFFFVDDHQVLYNCPTYWLFSDLIHCTLMIEFKHTHRHIQSYT